MILTVAALLRVTLAGLSCLVCDVHYVEGPDGRKIIQGTDKCIEPTVTTDMIGDYGTQGMCTTSFQKQLFENGTALVWYTRSGQKFRDPNMKYPTSLIGSECKFYLL